MSQTVYRTVNDLYAGEQVLDDSHRNPRSPDTWLIPAGCVTVPPPALRDGEQARWDGGAWMVEVLPETTPAAEPETGTHHIPQAQQANTIPQKRRATYPGLGDPLDAMLKAFESLAAQGLHLPEELTAVMQQWQATKEQHPATSDA